MWRAYTGVIHCAFDYSETTKLLSYPKQNQGGEGASAICRQALYWSIFKKSRHLGFDVFIDIWSMFRVNKKANITKNLKSVFLSLRKCQNWTNFTGPSFPSKT
jgi:hypothetical protein